MARIDSAALAAAQENPVIENTTDFSNWSFPRRWSSIQAFFESLRVTDVTPRYEVSKAGNIMLQANTADGKSLFLMVTEAAIEENEIKAGEPLTRDSLNGLTIMECIPEGGEPQYRLGMKGLDTVQIEDLFLASTGK